MFTKKSYMTLALTLSLWAIFGIYFSLWNQAVQAGQPVIGEQSSEYIESNGAEYYYDIDTHLSTNYWGWDAMVDIWDVIYPEYSSFINDGTNDQIPIPEDEVFQVRTGEQFENGSLRDLEFYYGDEGDPDVLDGATLYTTWVSTFDEWTLSDEQQEELEQNPDLQEAWGNIMETNPVRQAFGGYLERYGFALVVSGFSYSWTDPDSQEQMTWVNVQSTWTDQEEALEWIMMMELSTLDSSGKTCGCTLPENEADFQECIEDIKELYDNCRAEYLAVMNTLTAWLGGAATIACLACLIFPNPLTCSVCVKLAGSYGVVFLAFQAVMSQAAARYEAAWDNCCKRSCGQTNQIVPFVCPVFNSK